ncbi:hypothetical protein NIES593_03750 [Hydrococcus rivularis NIES-593]|uniref:DUF2808 domain-containing protein n=1 Tax=Hydrococcus rivularis NIES-593 TaxID=1921803 RepID=A0A1U7HRH6_9CYAN|nr:DUF2808 domain-containing protein [Hydrococcus rivularis]OKH26196.1 hypothetical protein NIES593_03750 [Hydrococcus rivularis NIES-593]
MFAIKLSAKRPILALFVSGCLLAGMQTIGWAQGNPGLTIFSGVERENILNYYLDFGGIPRQWDRYKLYVPAKKLTQGASKFFISYPEHFNGKFDTDKVEVRVNKESVPLREVYWDKESRVLEIDLERPIEAGTKATIVLSNVKNPDFGTYYFVCDAQAAGQVPVRLYLGTWIVSIEGR